MGARTPRSLGSLARAVGTSEQAVRARIGRLVGRLRHLERISGCDHASAAAVGGPERSGSRGAGLVLTSAPVSPLAMASGWHADPGPAAASEDRAAASRSDGGDREHEGAASPLRPFADLVTGGGPVLWLIVGLLAASAVCLALIVREFRDVLMPNGPPRFLRSWRRWAARRARRR